MAPWMRFARALASVSVGSDQALECPQPPDSVSWKCDDLTPNLCTDLTLTTDRVRVLDLDVHYYKYECGGGTTGATEAASEGGGGHDFLPVVVLSAGPGLPHNGDLPLRQLACGCHEDGGKSRPVLFYDPAGTGQSGLPGNATVTDTEYAYLDLPYYAETELPALLDAFRWERVHLVGQSYGTSVALQYALATGAERVASLVLNGPIPSVPEYYRAGWDAETGSIGTMPDYFRRRYEDLVERQDYDSEEFGALEQVLFSQFIYRSGILADCFLENCRGMNSDLYRKLFSVSEFVRANGTTKDFDVFPRLTELAAVPVLLTSGEFDTVRPPTVELMRKSLPKAEVVRFRGSAHVTWGDATGDLLRSVADFLRRVEAEGNKFEPRPGTSPPLAPPDNPPVGGHGSGTSDAKASALQPPTPPTNRRKTRWSFVFFFAFLVGLYFYLNRLDVWRNDRHRYEAVV